MSRIVRIAKWVRNNPKKSILFGSVASYGIHYAVERRTVRLMMRAYCREAQEFGEQPCRLGTSPRHVTVILNPRAKGSKTLYGDYAAPLLHLAGMKVSLFRTDHAGQARELMKIMDNTDAVIIAGGDGTLSEAVTGLLDREDRGEASERFPMGFVPTGKTNTLVRRLFFRQGMREQQLAAEAAMAVIRGAKTRVDAFKVDFHNEPLWTRSEEDIRDKQLRQLSEMDLQVEGIAIETKPKLEYATPSDPSTVDAAAAEVATDKTADKEPFLEKLDPVFGVGKIEYGIFRDIDAVIDRYWYFGPLRARAAYLFQSFRRRRNPEETEIRVGEVCTGCTRCMKFGLPAEDESAKNNEDTPAPAPAKRWWSSFVKKELPKKKDEKVNPFEQYRSVVNERCGEMEDTSICYTNLEVEPDGGALVVKASPATLDSTRVLLDGMKRHSSYATPCLTEQLRCGDLQFNFPQKDLTDPSYEPTPEELRDRNLRLRGPKINIDSEVYARQPISITLYPRAISVFK